MNRDRLTRARRSWNMSRIRGKDTTPEKAVRSLLHRLGYRFRLHVKIPIQIRIQSHRWGETPLAAPQHYEGGSSPDFKLTGRARAAAQPHNQKIQLRTQENRKGKTPLVFGS